MTLIGSWERIQVRFPDGKEREGKLGMEDAGEERQKATEGHTHTHTGQYTSLHTCMYLFTYM